MKEVNRRPNRVLLLNGWVSYTRYVLYPADEESKAKLAETGDKSVAPLDEYLGLDHLPFSISADMALFLARKSIQADSYQGLSESLLEERRIEISDDTLRRVTDYIGSIVDVEERRRIKEYITGYDASKPKAAKRRRGRPKTKDPLTLYIETDGAMYLARTEGNITKGWHENKLGLVFNSDQLEVTTNAKGQEVFKLGGREYTCNTDGVDAHKEALLGLAVKYGLYDADEVVVLGDGADWIKKFKDTYFPFATRILDECHVKEKIGQFAIQELGAGKPETSKWIAKACKMLEDGEWEKILELPCVAKYKDVKLTSEQKAKGKINLYSYLYNNQDALDYPEYRSKGFFCGSGAVESGHRTVMQKRIKQAGMQWKPSKAQGVLTLRAKLLSNLWDFDVVPLVRNRYRYAYRGL